MLRPEWMMPALLKITANDVTHVNTFIQEGAYAAITGPSSVLADLVDDDRQKRDLVVQRLNQMPGVSCALPEGTIYAFPSVKELGIPSQKLAELILEQAHVVVEAGSFYGVVGEGHPRGSASVQSLSTALRKASPVAVLQQPLKRCAREGAGFLALSS